MSDSEEDNTPLHHKKPFGSGLKRKQIAFVPASTGPLATTHENSKDAPKPTKSVSDLYLNIVLSGNSTPVSTVSDKNSQESTLVPECKVCSLPILKGTQGASQRHEASIAHQVCLTHSRPPSALNRSRMGLQVLQSQGWDPDARTGLGTDGQGMHYPIKATLKDDTLGIGVKVPKNLPPKKDKPVRMDAGKVRKQAAQAKKRNDQLRQEMFSSVDFDKYLGN